MAFVPDPNQINQQAQNPLTGQAPIQSSQAPGAGPGTAKVPTGAASNQAAPQPFTNLQSYLSANAPQVEQIANQISGTLTNQYGQVMNDVNTGNTNFL